MLKNALDLTGTAESGDKYRCVNHYEQPIFERFGLALSDVRPDWFMIDRWHLKI